MNEQQALLSNESSNHLIKQSTNTSDINKSSDGAIDVNVDDLLTNSEKELSLFRRLSYGFGYAGRQSIIIMQAYFFTYFLMEVVNLNAFVVTLILFLKQLYDAVNDPIMGVIRFVFIIMISTHCK